MYFHFKKWSARLKRGKRVWQRAHWSRQEAPRVGFRRRSRAADAAQTWTFLSASCRTLHPQIRGRLPLWQFISVTWSPASTIQQNGALAHASETFPPQVFLASSLDRFHLNVTALLLSSGGQHTLHTSDVFFWREIKRILDQKCFNWSVQIKDAQVQNDHGRSESVIEHLLIPVPNDIREERWDMTIQNLPENYLILGFRQYQTNPVIVVCTSMDTQQTGSPNGSFGIFQWSHFAKMSTNIRLARFFRLPFPYSSQPSRWAHKNSRIAAVHRSDLL